MARKKISALATFYSLPKRQQKAVMLLFSNKMTQAQVAKEIDCDPSSITRWKEREDFREAQDEYNRFMLRDLTNEAVITMRELLHAHSEMVRFSTAKDILDRTITGLESAQKRKANAEAAMAEAKLADMQDNKGDQMDALGVLLNEIKDDRDGETNGTH